MDLNWPYILGGGGILLLVLSLWLVVERVTRLHAVDKLNLKSARLSGNFLFNYQPSGVLMDLILGSQKLVLNIAPTAAGAPAVVTNVVWSVTNPSSGTVAQTTPDGLNAEFVPAQTGPYEVTVSGTNSAGVVITEKTSGNIALAAADALGLTAKVVPLTPAP